MVISQIFSCTLSFSPCHCINTNIFLGPQERRRRGTGAKVVSIKYGVFIKDVAVRFLSDCELNDFVKLQIIDPNLYLNWYTDSSKKYQFNRYFVVDSVKLKKALSRKLYLRVVDAYIEYGWRNKCATEKRCVMNNDEYPYQLIIHLDTSSTIAPCENTNLRVSSFYHQWGVFPDYLRTRSYLDPMEKPSFVEFYPLKSKKFKDTLLVKNEIFPGNNKYDIKIFVDTNEK